MHRTKTFLDISIRLIILVGIVMLIIFFISTCNDSSLIQKIDNTLPGIESAPYEIVTVTRTYIAEQVREKTDGSVEITNWYTRNDGKWQLNESTVIVSSVVRPKISQRLVTE